MNRLVLIAALFVLTLSSHLYADDAANQKLWAAARSGDMAAIENALAAGADVNSIQPKDYGKTALHLAAERGHTDAVSKLLASKANLNAKDTFYQDTPLGWAVYSRRTAVVGLLLDAGAEGADAALSTAQQRGDLETMAIIIEKGKVKPETLSRCLAQAKDRADIVALLEKAGAKLAPPPGEPVAADVISAVVGKYMLETGEAIELKAENGKLLRHRPPAPVDEWRSTGKDTLVPVNTPTTKIELERSGDRVTGFVVTSGEMKWNYKRDETKETPLPADLTRDVPGRIIPRNWPSFRGPNASGIGDDQWPPLTWDLAKGDNIRWKTKIPGLGNSCPVVWGDSIFITTAVRADGEGELILGGGDVDSVADTSEHSWRIYRFDRHTGEILWQREAHRGVPKVKRHAKATHADCTPATDGKHLVVNFGSEGLFCYDFAGNQLWKRDLGTLDAGWFFNSDYQWGYGSSPILFRDLVIVQCDIRQDSFIAAYGVSDGAEKWRTARDEISSWGTPTIVDSRDRVELVTNATKFARGYDPRTGTELWKLGRNAEITVPTPVFADDLIFVTSGYRAPTQPIYAIRPGARGDLTLGDSESTNDSIAWSTQKGGPYMGTPIAYRQHLYVCKSDGILTIYETTTGKVVFGPRRVPGGGAYTASPVAADGRVYFTSEDGRVRVMQAQPPFAWLAENELNEPCLATPAISAGMLLFRTKSHLIGVGRPK